MQTHLMAEQIAQDQTTIGNLRDEVEQLTLESRRRLRCMDGRGERILEQVDEIARLKAERDRLRTALVEAVAMLEVDPEADTPGSDLYTFLKGDAPAALAAD